MMKTISMLIAAAAGMMAIAAGTAAADGMTKVVCTGTVTLQPDVSTLLVRTADGQTFTEFDFTGTHTFCDPAGNQVPGTISGHLIQETRADGDMTLRFYETAAFLGGTLDFRGGASLSGGSWESHVESVGPGTGPLVGVSGHGSFFPTSVPGVFSDELTYLFH